MRTLAKLPNIQLEFRNTDNQTVAKTIKNTLHLQLSHHKQTTGKLQRDNVLNRTACVSIAGRFIDQTVFFRWFS